MKQQAKQLLADLGFVVSSGEGFGPADLSAARAALNFRKSDLDENGRALLKSLAAGRYHAVDALRGADISAPVAKTQVVDNSNTPNSGTGTPEDTPKDEEAFLDEAFLDEPAALEDSEKAETDNETEV